MIEPSRWSGRFQVARSMRKWGRRAAAGQQEGEEGQKKRAKVEQGQAAQVVGRGGAEEEEGKVGSLEHLEFAVYLYHIWSHLAGSRGLKRGRGGGNTARQQQLSQAANNGEDRGEREPKVWFDMF